MKSSDAVALYLESHGVDHCFEVVGGMITHLLDSLSRHGAIQIISMHHEQGAAFAAEGISRITKGGELGLAMATSGPGATNLITGIGSCYFDSIPCLFITGQVNKNELRGNAKVRQQGFQELDIVEMVRPITKYAVQVTDGRDLMPELHKAAVIALSGRKGPVLLDVTFNAQREEVEDKVAKEWIDRPWEPEPLKLDMDKEAMQKALQMISEAKRPLVLFGGGAVWSPGLDKFIGALHESRVPYTATLLGAQWLPVHDDYLGMMGTYGRRSANWAIMHCDLLLVLGARLDVRQTGSDAQDFAREAKIIQVDIERGQLDNRVKAELSLHASVEDFITSADWTGRFRPAQDWTGDAVVKLKERLDVDEYDEEGITPFRLFQVINRVYSSIDADFVADVGNHQMWSGALLDLRDGQSAHYCGGMGAMGFGLPASIGMSLLTGRKTVNLTGDGSVQMNIQELDTLKRLDLDVTVLIMNNAALGMVKNFQDMYFNGLNQSTVIGVSQPDFEQVGKAYGIWSTKVSTVRALESALKSSIVRKGPFVLDVIMSSGDECRPRLAFGCKLDDQMPK